MENRKTLFSITSHPLRRAAKFGIPASALAKKLLTVSKHSNSANPDNQAIRFYALNQIVGLMLTKYTPNQPLPAWGEDAVRLYCEELEGQHQRMVWYTFLVISREWRHLKNLATVSSGPTKSLMYPPELKSLHPLIADSQDEGHLNKWLAKVPDMAIHQYCEALTHSFNTGSWGGGYGGKPWGMISKTLQRYFDGSTSAETFIDTAYTLAHNNGPMFNKGMMYEMYSGEFKIILDVQRSGQVAEGIVEGRYGSVSDIYKVLMACKSELGIGEYIDWYKVESLGALQSYPQQKKQQDQKYGKKPVAPKMALKDGKPIKVTGTYEWWPEQTVEVYERVTA